MYIRNLISKFHRNEPQGLLIIRGVVIIFILSPIFSFLAYLSSNIANDVAEVRTTFYTENSMPAPGMLIAIQKCEKCKSISNFLHFYRRFFRF